MKPLTDEEVDRFIYLAPEWPPHLAPNDLHRIAARAGMMKAAEIAGQTLGYESRYDNAQANAIRAAAGGQHG